MLTQENLKNQLNYNKETGIFTNLITRSIRSKSGKIPGTEVGQNGYVRIRVNGKFYLAHRLAWLYVYGYFPPGCIDHINRIRNDNRISNLRLATIQQNNQNCGLRKDNKSGHKGIYWNKKRNKWHARTSHCGKSLHIGYFDNLEKANMAYINLIMRLHGEYFNDCSQNQLAHLT